MTKPIPEGYHSITPVLMVDGAAKALEFYKKAFGAEERARMPAPDGKIAHCEFKVGDSIIMMSDVMPGFGAATKASLYMYVSDCDAVWNRALAAGGKTNMPMEDAFWGDRCGTLEDPFGNKWTISTHKEDVSPQEMEKRAATFMAKMASTAEKK